MIKMAIDIRTHPDKHMEFTQTLENLIYKFQQERGNISYQYTPDKHQRNLIHIDAEWSDWTTLENHFDGKFFKILFGAIRGLCEEPDIRISNGNNESVADAIKKLRDENNIL